MQTPWSNTWRKFRTIVNILSGLQSGQISRQTPEQYSLYCNSPIWTHIQFSILQRIRPVAFRRPISVLQFSNCCYQTPQQRTYAKLIRIIRTCIEQSVVLWYQCPLQGVCRISQRWDTARGCFRTPSGHLLLVSPTVRSVAKTYVRQKLGPIFVFGTFFGEILAFGHVQVGTCSV